MEQTAQLEPVASDVTVARQDAAAAASISGFGKKGNKLHDTALSILATVSALVSASWVSQQGLGEPT